MHWTKKLLIENAGLKQEKRDLQRKIDLLQTARFLDVPECEVKGCNHESYHRFSTASDDTYLCADHRYRFALLGS